MEEEELNGPHCGGFQSVLTNSSDDGNSMELCGDRSLHSGSGLMPCDEPESLAAYPITLPGMPLSFATVQWDEPSTPTDLLPGTDSSSVEELSCSDGVSPDWVVNPLSLVSPTLTESESADGMLPNGNGVRLPQSGISDQHADVDQQACDSVEAVLVMNLMASCDKEETSVSGDGEISQHEEHTVEEMGPAEADCTENTLVIQILLISTTTTDQGGRLSTPGIEENQPHPETVTATEAQHQQGCSTDGGNDGEIVELDDETLEEDKRENTSSDSAQDGECVGTDSSLCCEEDTVLEQPVLIQENTDTEEIPLSGEDEQCNPDEESMSVDQMMPEPTEHQECLQPPESESDIQADSSQLCGCTEQGEPPEAGDELCELYYNSSGPEETSACEEGLDRGQGSKVTQLTHGGETSSLTEQEIESLEGTLETERTETGRPSECAEGGEVEETETETAGCSEETEDQQEVENMEAEEQQQIPLQSQEKEQSLCSVESESSGIEPATAQAERMEKTEEGGLSDEAKQTEHQSETVMEESDMTKPIEQSDETRGEESSETNQNEESIETNHTEETNPTEAKESSETGGTNESEQIPTEQSEEAGQTDTPEQSETKQGEEQMEASQQTERTEQAESTQTTTDSNPSEQPVSAVEGEDSLVRHMEGKTEQLEGQMQETGDSGVAVPYMNGGGVDREAVRTLAEKLFRLEGIHRTDVVQHLDKDNEFSRAVGEEYLKFFDFTSQTLDKALRAFLKVVVLIGETQERERVLQRFSSRFHECSPHACPSAGAVLTLTCAMMLLNSDLHGQNVGKSMSQSDFVSNLDGMDEGENFSKDVLKGLYNSIKNEPLEWAVDEKELQSSMMLPEDAGSGTLMRSKGNPFQSVPHDKKATVFHKGFLKRKAHADIDGKRTPWGKRKWKTFYCVLKGMVLYLQKDDYSSDWQSSEEVVSVHHALAERAVDYTKRPYVFRLQTADWRVFLFEAASTEQMSSWIGRINLVSALYSSPPFPAAVGSQRKFFRPILPASQSSLTLDKQLQSHAAMLQSFQEDLAHLQEGFPEGRKPKARELEEHKIKEEYLQHERCRYEVYVQMLEAWSSLKRSSTSGFNANDLGLFDREVGRDTHDEEEDEADGGMKRSHSSPSLELETAPPPVVKVRRNISERRTYRKIIIPRRNREL